MIFLWESIPLFIRWHFPSTWLILINPKVLKDHLHEAWEGHTSSTLHVRSQRGDIYTLPFSLWRISEYYRFVPTVMFLDTNVVHLAMIIPLRKNLGIFVYFTTFFIPWGLNDALHNSANESIFLTISIDKLDLRDLRILLKWFCNIQILYCIEDTPHYKTQHMPPRVLG